MEKGLSAAAAAMPGEVTRDAFNKFAKYDYATADSIYQAVRSHVAAQGLAVWQQEVECGIVPDPSGKGGPWIKATYEMALTPDGARPEHAERITVMTMATGAQAFAAIRTYALKYWLRGKFLLATGDLDEDVDAVERVAPPEPVSETGTWTLDEDSMTLRPEGDWATDRARQVAFFRALSPLLAPDADHQRALAAYAANEEEIDKLPENGRTIFLQRVKTHMQAAQKDSDNGNE